MSRSRSIVERRAAIAEGAADVLEGLGADRRKAILARIEALITKEMRDGGDHGNDKTPFELRESAYRRGYEQAVAAIAEHLGVEGFVEARLEVVAYERVIHNWRYRYGRFEQRRDVVERAPEPGEFKADGFSTRKNPSFQYGPISAQKKTV